MRRALVDMGVPAADVDEAKIILFAHQPADAAGGKLKTARRHRAAVGGGHFLRDRAVDVVAHLETFLDGGGEIAVRIHLLDELGLAVIDPGFADRVDADIGDLRLAAERQRQLVGKGNRLDPAKLRRQPAHEAGAVVARAGDGLAEFDRVLGFEMAAADVVRRPRKRNERDLAFRP